jgi:hypothetical protein
MMQKKLTYPAEAIYTPLALGLVIQAIGLLFFVMGENAVCAPLLVAGSVVALLMPLLFLSWVLATPAPNGGWFCRGNWSPATWCCYRSPDHVLRFTESKPLLWPLLAYVRARFMALEAEFFAPQEYGVNFTVVETSNESARAQIVIA